MSNADYSHIKKGMCVLVSEIEDEDTWKEVTKAFVSAGAYGGYSCACTYTDFVYRTQQQYGWGCGGDLSVSTMHKFSQVVSVAFILGVNQDHEEEEEEHYPVVNEVFKCGSTYVKVLLVSEELDTLGRCDVFGGECCRSGVLTGNSGQWCSDSFDWHADNHKTLRHPLRLLLTAQDKAALSEKAVELQTTLDKVTKELNEIQSKLGE